MEAKNGCAIGKRMHGVGAGEDEPVVFGERAQRTIEGRKIQWRLNLDDWNFDRLGAESAQTFTELAGLVRGARDADAPASERQRGHQATPPGVSLLAARRGPAPCARSTSAA